MKNSLSRMNNDRYESEMNLKDEKNTHERKRGERHSPCNLDKEKEERSRKK